MMRLRKSADRGYFENHWLRSYHSFSFGEYFDRKHMEFHGLRVINHDFIAASAGFPTHSHKDMEIITYVLRGELEHQDSLGNRARITPGEVQVMSAGSGISHSEYNPLADKELELLQIWITPNARDLKPGYTQKMFSHVDKENKLQLVASPDGVDESLKIHQDARVYASILAPGKELDYSPEPGRSQWFQVARGVLRVNDQVMATGDGLAIEAEPNLRLHAEKECEFIFFDLA